MVTKKELEKLRKQKDKLEEHQKMQAEQEKLEGEIKALKKGQTPSYGKKLDPHVKKIQKGWSKFQDFADKYG